MQLWKNIRTWLFILLCEQMHLAYKVPHQAAAAYRIWLIGVHVVLSYHKTSALSLQLWEDLRPVSLIFLCRSIISFFSEQFPFGSSCLCPSSAALEEKLKEEEDVMDIQGALQMWTLLTFGDCTWDREYCRGVVRLWSASGPEGMVPGLGRHMVIQRGGLWSYKYGHRKVKVILMSLWEKQSCTQRPTKGLLRNETSKREFEDIKIRQKLTDHQYADTIVSLGRPET